MCILLCEKLIQCSDIPQIYGQLEEGNLILLFTSYEKMSSLCNLFGVVVFQRSIVNWRSGVGIHLVQWYSIDLWSIGGGGYM